MIKIMMHGCCGHMGQVISELVEKDPEAEITVGVDIADKGNTSYPVYTDLSACQEDVDVVIDFSSAKAVDALLDYCGERKLPLVLCTTGLSEEQLARVEENSSAEISKYVSWNQYPSETDPGGGQGSGNSRI